jgi:formylglycine-generating enzyme required for sulfatase activity
MTAIFCMSGHDLSMATFRDPAVTVVQLECLVAVRNVLVRAVAWEPDLRFPDAAAMLEALRGAIGDTSQSVTADDIGAAQTPIVIEALTPAVESSGPRGSAPIGGVDSMPEAPERPRWAVASGRDHHGIWAAFQVNRVRQRMRWIPPGTFRMGSPETEWGRWNNEGPQHEVTLHRGFWFGETPVTQLLWRAVMGMNSSRFVGEWRLSGERPVESVSWDDCHAFLGRLNAEISGLAARLPSETEWERACRAGTSGPTWASKLSQGVDAHELEAIAWYGENSGGMPNQVGRKAANPYGLHDILGNVFEWCQDPAERVVARYSREFELPEHSSHRMIRGGSWYSRARRVRSASRYACARDFRGDSVGFRLAAS